MHEIKTFVKSDVDEQFFLKKALNCRFLRFQTENKPAG